MKCKFLLILLFPLFAIWLLNSCGSGERGNKILQNGYNDGYKQAQSDIRRVRNMVEPSKRGLMDANQFYAPTAYELMRRSLASFNVEDVSEEDYRAAWIDGYNDGVDSELGGGGRHSYSESTNDYSADTSSKTGINFWQWCIILFVVVMVIGSLSPDDKTSTEKTTEEDTDPSTSKEVIAENNTKGIASPWKSLLLVCFALVFFIVMDNIFTLTVSDKSTYMVLFLALVMAYMASDNIAKYRQNIKKDFLSSLVKILSIIVMLIMGLLLLFEIFIFFFD